MADKKISDFATLSDVQSTDLLLVSSNSETYNVKAETLMASIKEDVLDNGAVRYDAAQSLTTNQKTQSRDNIDAASTADISGRVAVNQGTSNAGKMMVVGSNGNVAPQDVDMVRYNSTQTLTSTQKAKARANIGAATISVNGTKLVIQTQS